MTRLALAVVLAGCDPNSAPPGVVTARRTYRVGGIHTHLLQVRPDVGAPAVEVRVSRPVYRACQVGDRWPTCGGAS